jgi:hypothetical protein
LVRCSNATGGIWPRALCHELGDGLARDDLTVLAQVSGDPWCTVHAVGAGVNWRILSSSFSWRRARAEGPVACRSSTCNTPSGTLRAGHTSARSQGGLLRVDQPERPLWLFEAFSVTKKAAAFSGTPDPCAAGRSQSAAVPSRPARRRPAHRAGHPSGPARWRPTDPAAAPQPRSLGRPQQWCDRCRSPDEQHHDSTPGSTSTSWHP